jgi:hypothetical protein
MGLRKDDLKDLVDNIFEIDSFKSKMGSDSDIVVLSFSTKNEGSAKDLENFLEKGYPFVLDADATTGEQSDGMYKVFVEIERSKDSPMQIYEMVDGITKISGLDSMKFRYYKSFRSHDATDSNLAEMIPTDKDAYDIRVNESNMDNYKNFFNKSYAEEVDMISEDTLRIKNTFMDPITFKVVDFARTDEVNINEALDINGFAEVIYLSKYLGDYNITKYGKKLVLENGDYSLILKRG